MRKCVCFCVFKGKLVSKKQKDHLDSVHHVHFPETETKKKKSVSGKMN